MKNLRSAQYEKYQSKRDSDFYWTGLIMGMITGFVVGAVTVLFFIVH